MKSSKIVSIPEKMEKFYGKGTMLHPSVNDIEILIKKIPKGYVTTIDTLTKRLSKDFNTDVACPMRTGNAIKKISERYSNDNIDYKVPFWRVIRTNKMVVKSNNFEFWAIQLEAEGFKLDFTKKNDIKITADSNHIFTF